MSLWQRGRDWLRGGSTDRADLVRELRRERDSLVAAIRGYESTLAKRQAQLAVVDDVLRRLTAEDGAPCT